MKSTLAILVVATALAAGCATAYDVDDRYFTPWDANRDGLLDRNEFTTAGFEMWDDDNDGIVELAEWGNLRLDRDFGAFDTWDTNRDLGIDATEFGVGVDSTFSRWDRDRDGFLERDEFGV